MATKINDKVGNWAKRELQSPRETKNAQDAQTSLNFQTLSQQISNENDSKNGAEVSRGLLKRGSQALQEPADHLCSGL